MTNWQKLKSDFISGKTLSVIAKENDVPFDTVKSRHRSENWSKARVEYKRKTSENLTNKLAENEANKIFDEIENIKALIKQAERQLPNAEVISQEGLIRAINELYKTLGSYTGKTVQKNETSTNLKVQPIPILGGLSCNIPGNNSCI